jgi:O-antigen/teichoic acid export membrane protein
MDFGIATVAAITALVYIVGLGVKATKLDNKWIPVICGAFGIVLGIVALYIGVPDFPATDPLTAAAVGGASGLAATGLHQAVKQLKE